MTESLLINHIAALYCCEELGEAPLFDAWMFAKDGVIEAIGTGDYSGPAADTILDGRHMLVVPGFINVHHHFSQSLTRVVPHGLKGRTLDWLKAMYLLWQELDPASMHAGSRLAAAQLMKSGVTTSVDHAYFYPGGQDTLLDVEIEGVGALGLRMHAVRGCVPLLEGPIQGELVKVSGADQIAFTEEPETSIEACKRALDRFHDDSPLSMLRIGVGPTQVTYRHPDLMVQMSELADVADCDKHIHISPRPEDVALCKDLNGCRPTAYLERIGWLKPKTVLVHCPLHTPEDIAVLAGTGAGVAHCPSQNMRLGFPVGPIPEMRQAGIEVALGVDGAGSNDGGSMLTEMRLATLIHRIAGTHTNFTPDDWLDPHEVLWMATRSGAEILGRDRLGRLAPGCAADITMIDMSQLAYAGGLHDPLACALFIGDTGQIHTTIVNGKITVRDGRLVTGSEADIADAANRESAAMVTRMKLRTGLDLGSMAPHYVAHGAGVNPI